MSSDGEIFESSSESDNESESTSTDSSPNTRLLRKMEEHISNTPATTRDELKQKLRQKMMIKQTQRLSRYGQKIKLDNMKQDMAEKMEGKNNTAEDKVVMTEEEMEKKREKIREKRRLKRQRQNERRRQKKLLESKE